MIDLELMIGLVTLLILSSLAGLVKTLFRKSRI